MILGFVVTLLLGSLAIVWGMRWGRFLVRKGATANNLFIGRNIESIAFLGLYLGLLVLALHLPQLQILPLEWRVYGMRITWIIMRVLLLGFCGVAFVVSWKTARMQVIAVVLLGLIGLGSFTTAEAYFLAPIYSMLEDNLQPNGIFRQTSNSSCAPAALATILRRWQIDATESSIAKLAETSRLGTSMPQLIVAARALGMDGIELASTWEQMQRINRPGVLATWLYSDTGRGPHAVGIVAITDDTVTIADPAFGKLYQLDQAQFRHIWRNQYVPIFPPADLILAPEQAADYLHRLGYVQQKTNLSTQELAAAIQQFQTAVGVAATGKLNPETVLLLRGAFLTEGPTLNTLESNEPANSKSSRSLF
ncbi:cysteine peptidase family C39 domain-containing protein [Leptolyngbya sp. NK1-12]|uniref:cysteine peptidase family C39 domain-containing protein n=1 Tax=Leptolyngbya sp. NK1-12 TaxID=2547451 RepID=UPI00292FCFAB